MHVSADVQRMLASLMLLVLATSGAVAQGPPPARVTVATIGEGRISPSVDLEASVFFKEVSHVATELNGLVTEVHFEEGQRLNAGEIMVRLDQSLLEPQLRENRALVEQAKARLKQENARMRRAAELMADEITTPQQFDDIRFTAEAFDRQVAAAEARVQQIERELEKKVIRAPFDGIVLERMTELGEWKGVGESIAIFALDQVYDIVTNVPEAYLGYATPGMHLHVRVGRLAFEAEVVESAPRGDVTTRTFPIRLRVTGRDDLLEGLSAVVSMPTGTPTDCLLVPRDAVIMERGEMTITVVEDDKARKVPVRVLGYTEGQAGLEKDGLSPGMTVITKGHERIRTGDAVSIMNP